MLKLETWMFLLAALLAAPLSFVALEVYEYFYGEHLWMELDFSLEDEEEKGE
jgi:hypothetical protein